MQRQPVLVQNSGAVDDLVFPRLLSAIANFVYFVALGLQVVR
jgi:hypothetical protein